MDKTSIQWTPEHIKELKAYSRRRTLWPLCMWTLLGPMLFLIYAKSKVHPNILNTGVIWDSPWLSSWYGGFLLGGVYFTLFAMMGHGVWAPWERSE